MSSIDRYIQDAYDIAEMSACQMKHGAIIVRGGNIISRACNRKVTHPTSAKYARDPKQITTIHAEQRALIFSRDRVRNATLVSVRLNGNKSSKPCPMCRALMQDAGIHSVIYYDGRQFVKERL